MSKDQERVLSYEEIQVLATKFATEELERLRIEEEKEAIKKRQEEEEEAVKCEAERTDRARQREENLRNGSLLQQRQIILDDGQESNSPSSTNTPDNNKKKSKFENSVIIAQQQQQQRPVSPNRSDLHRSQIRASMLSPQQRQDIADHYLRCIPYSYGFNCTLSQDSDAVFTHKQRYNHPLDVSKRVADKVMIGKTFDSAKMPAGLMKFYMNANSGKIVEPDDTKTAGTNAL